MSRRTVVGVRTFALAVPIVPLLAVLRYGPADAPVSRYEYRMATDDRPPDPLSREPMPAHPQPEEPRVAVPTVPLRLRRPWSASFDEIPLDGLQAADAHTQRPRLRRAHFW